MEAFDDEDSPADTFPPAANITAEYNPAVNIHMCPHWLHLQCAQNFCETDSTGIGNCPMCRAALYPTISCCVYAANDAHALTQEEHAAFQQQIRDDFSTELRILAELRNRAPSMPPGALRDQARHTAAVTLQLPEHPEPEEDLFPDGDPANPIAIQDDHDPSNSYSNDQDVCLLTS